MLITSPISTTFYHQKGDDVTPSTSRSSSNSSSAVLSSSASYEFWMNTGSLKLDEEIDRQEISATCYLDISNKSWRVGRISTFALISAYFLLNVALTFYNKLMMINFPYPYFITALHSGSGTIGCLFLRGIGVQFENSRGESMDDVLERGSQLHKKGSPQDPRSIHPTTDLSQTKLSFTGMFVVLSYSTLYAANIAISNASLRLVSVPLHQIVRSTCPIFTLILGFFLLAKKIQRASLFPLVSAILGAALACFGDVNATTFGFILTVLGTVLAALKTVVTNLLQGGHKERMRGRGEQESRDLSRKAQKQQQQQQQQSAVQRWQLSLQNHAFQFTALELLEVMSPLACVQCLLASQFSGELQQAYLHFAEGTVEGHFNWSLLLLLIGNGFVAFLLNIISFKTNKVAGPLTMTIVANLKQVVTILLAFQVFHLQIQRINLLGVLIALFGTAWYGTMEMNLRRSA